MLLPLLHIYINETQNQPLDFAIGDQADIRARERTWNHRLMYSFIHTTWKTAVHLNGNRNRAKSLGFIKKAYL